METLLANLTGKIRREILNGRDYIVAPLTLIVPGVLNGSKGALYYPPEEVRRDPTVWNHIPIVVYHPTYNGEHVSARDPVILERQGIGHVFRANARNKAGNLVAEGWFDEEKTRKVDRRILDNLKSGKPIELSTGLFTDNDLAENGASYNGKPYQFTARNYRPDHLAILPDQIGACSIQDGCGVLVNERQYLTNEWVTLDGGQRVFIGESGKLQYTGPGEDSGEGKSSSREVKEKPAEKKSDSTSQKFYDTHRTALSSKFGKEVADKVMSKVSSKNNPSRDHIADELHKMGLIKSRVISPYATSNMTKNAKDALGHGSDKRDDKDSERFPSIHNPAITYGNKEDRDSDDKYFSDKIRRAKADVASAQKALEKHTKEADEKSREITETMKQKEQEFSGKRLDIQEKGRLKAQAIADKYATKKAASEEKLKARLATANSGLVVNPPSWAVDEEKWDRAKAAADKGNYEGDTYWQVVSHIYQNMGGEIGSKATKNSEAIINQPRHQIDGQFLPTAGPATKQTTTAAVKGYESSEGGSALVGEPNAKGEDGRSTSKLVKELLGEDFDGDNDLEEDAENLDAFQDSVDATKETNNYLLETTMLNRDVILAKLTANCKCEESKCVLNKIDDEMLTNLYAGLVANEAKSAARNMNGDLAEDEEDEDSEVGKGLEEGAKIVDKDKTMMYKDKMSGNQRQHATMAEWEAGMPDEARAVWNAAKEVERAERARIVQRLVANVQDEKEREAVGNQLFKHKIDELRLLLRLVPNPTNNFRIQQEREDSYTNYLGASGGPATTNRYQDSAADDVLDLPTLNYEEIAAEQRKQKATA